MLKSEDIQTMFVQRCWIFSNIDKIECICYLYFFFLIFYLIHFTYPLIISSLLLKILSFIDVEILAQGQAFQLLLYAK